MMRPQKEHIFVCNGASCKVADAVVLDYRKGAKERIVKLRLPHFIDQLNFLSDRGLDLLEMAAYVFAADRSTSRGAKDAVEFHAWSRKMHFIIKVRDHAFWKQDKVKKALSGALEFMTGDAQYTFEFQPGHSTPQQTSLFDREEFSLKVDNPTSVVLFSGGLDSLSGAVEQLEHTQNDLFLISHWSGLPSTKKVQKYLVEALKQNYPGRVRHYAFECGLRGGRPPDETQRTRAFLFGSIAFAVAYQANLTGCFAYENGVTSLNFARREDARNGRSSRTTHPKTHALMEKFMRLFSDQNFEIENPFWNQSKTDVISKLGNSRSKDLISSAVSCSSTFDAPGSASHCGCCFQCIDRRLSAYAAGMQDYDDVGIYGYDVVTKTMPDHQTKTAVLDYVRQAYGFNESSLDSFYMPRLVELTDAAEFMKLPDVEAVEAIWKLCKMHGEQIAAGIIAVRNQHDDPQYPLETGSLLDILARRTHLKDVDEEDISNRKVVEELSSKIDAVGNAVIPHAKRGSKTVSSASAGGKSRSASYEPKYDEARKFMLQYNEDNPLVSFTEVRKKAAKKVGVSEGTLKNHIKKSDFPDWKTS
jgi:7-cyano-7-deazaguanine synthase in queuosine biosynthesis